MCRALSNIREESLDIIFMDPPYGCGHERAVLDVLREMPYVTEDTVIITEAALDTDFSWARALGFGITREKCYKTNKHVFLQKI